MTQYVPPMAVTSHIMQSAAYIVGGVEVTFNLYSNLVRITAENFIHECVLRDPLQAGVLTDNPYHENGAAVITVPDFDSDNFHNFVLTPIDHGVNITHEIYFTDDEDDKTFNTEFEVELKPNNVLPPFGWVVPNQGSEVLRYEYPDGTLHLRNGWIHRDRNMALAEELGKHAIPQVETGKWLSTDVITTQRLAYTFEQYERVIRVWIGDMLYESVLEEPQRRPVKIEQFDGDTQDDKWFYDVGEQRYLLQVYADDEETTLEHFQVMQGEADRLLFHGNIHEQGMFPFKSHRYVKDYPHLFRYQENFQPGYLDFSWLGGDDDACVTSMS